MKLLFAAEEEEEKWMNRMRGKIDNGTRPLNHGSFCHFHRVSPRLISFSLAGSFRTVYAVKRTSIGHPETEVQCDKFIEECRKSLGCRIILIKWCTSFGGRLVVTPHIVRRRRRQATEKDIVHGELGTVSGARVAVVVDWLLYNDGGSDDVR